MEQVDILFEDECNEQDVNLFLALSTMKKRDIAAPLHSSYGKYSIYIPDVVR